MADAAPAHAEAAQRVRESAKWAIASFGVIGALLVAGSQLSDLGAITSAGRLGWAIIGAVLALGCVAGAVVSSASLLLPRELSLTQLAKLEGDTHSQQGSKHPAVRFLRSNPELLSSWPTISKIKEDRDNDFTAYQHAYRAWLSNPCLETKLQLAQAKERSKPAAQAALTAVRWANFATLRHRYTFTRGLIVTFSLIAAAGLVVFGWAAHPPKQPAPFLRSAQLVGADLRSAQLQNADLTEANLTNANLQGANLAGAKVGRAIWSNTTCPDGKNSDDVPQPLGTTVQSTRGSSAKPPSKGSCEGHLTP